MYNLFSKTIFFLVKKKNLGGISTYIHYHKKLKLVTLKNIKKFGDPKRLLGSLVFWVGTE